MYVRHPIDGFLPTQLQLSQAAAERYAICAALRECRHCRPERNVPLRQRTGDDEQ